MKLISITPVGSEWLIRLSWKNVWGNEQFAEYAGARTVWRHTTTGHTARGQTEAFCHRMWKLNYNSPTHDCRFYYFKASGKWGYEGKGWFPHGEVIHETINLLNGGMPGISSDGMHMTILVIPEDWCKSPEAYPRLLKAIHV
jgi:hypothetical protein